MVPKDWDTNKLRSYLLSQPDYGANASATEYDSNSTLRYIRITDIDESGRLIESKKAGIPFDEGKEYQLQDGDLIVARTGATVGKSFFYSDSIGPCAFAGYLIRLRVNHTKLSVDFLRQYLMSPPFWHWVYGTVKVGAQPNISAKEYASMPIPVISLPEQRKIASILSTWDKAIEQVQKLIDAKARLKKGLMQQLLTGKRRFKKFRDSEFIIIKLRELLIPIARPISKPEQRYKALGIRSHGKGTFQRIIENPSKIMMDTLFEVKHNDLIVNITFAWEGAIALVSSDDEGCLVSHRFPTYVINSKMILVEYLRHIILLKKFVHDLGLISPGGAGRNRVLSKKDFLKLQICLPKTEEQAKISALLSGLEKEIDLLKSYNNSLQNQKKGLMQVLLTGKVRLKIHVAS